MLFSDNFRTNYFAKYSSVAMVLLLTLTFLTNASCANQVDNPGFENEKGLKRDGDNKLNHVIQLPFSTPYAISFMNRNRIRHSKAWEHID